MVDMTKKNLERSKLAAVLYGKLKSGIKVAKRMDVSPQTAYRLLAQAGIDLPGRADPKPNRKLLDSSRELALVADYQNGMTLRKLVAKYKVGDWTVRETIRRAGSPLRKRGGGMHRKLTPAQESEIAEIYGAGSLSQAMIAAKFKTSQVTISRVIRTAGLNGGRKSGAEHGSYKGGVVNYTGGYLAELVSPSDPLASMRHDTGYVLQHRLVMARSLGRPLERHETVHHINGDRKDNSIGNLQLRQGKHGKGVVMTCASCGSHNIVARELD